MNPRAERVRLHREIAQVYRDHGMRAMAEIHEGIADGLARIDGLDARIEQAYHELYAAVGESVTGEATCGRVGDVHGPAGIGGQTRRQTPDGGALETGPPG